MKVNVIEFHTDMWGNTYTEECDVTCYFDD